MIIFAYGSNMSLKRLQQRTPSARKVSNAMLPHYNLVCNKISKDGSAKANIVPDINGTGVFGVLYEITDAEKPLLDAAEGLGKGYTEKHVKVFDMDINAHIVLTYIAQEDTIDNNLLPFDWYKNFIVSGAVENELPENYINQLRAINHIEDSDKKRRAANLAIIN